MLAMSVPFALTVRIYTDIMSVYIAINIFKMSACQLEELIILTYDYDGIVFNINFSTFMLIFNLYLMQ